MLWTKGLREEETTRSFFVVSDVVYMYKYTIAFVLRLYYYVLQLVTRVQNVISSWRKKFYFSHFVIKNGIGKRMNIKQELTIEKDTSTIAKWKLAVTLLQLFVVRNKKQIQSKPLSDTPIFIFKIKIKKSKKI